ncbi:HNH endonuclease [Klebsiella variicola]|uniref:HNH endonuclease n=1 Tax=Klebsiella variicola TaxID=244366 RepID=UPI002404C8E5|nr:HNH endonuclease [Klebsiella variicola]MDG0490074.1 HNH endonuclease [Klebsiella variicola]
MARYFRQDPPPDELRERLYYKDGGLYYFPGCDPRGKKFADKPLGCIHSTGYVNMSLKCGDKIRVFRAHRLIYWFVKNEWVAAIDHIDGNKLNNHIDNLRSATDSENNRNAVNRKDNKSGYRGVCYHKPSSSWRIDIKIDGKRFYKYGYITKETAALARDILIRLFYGDFARYGISEAVTLKVGDKVI